MRKVDAGRRAPAAPAKRVLATPPSIDDVVRVLDTVAPLALAAPWDNVGLLVPPVEVHSRVARVVLTIDLSERVLDDAIAAGADLVVAYHPPIFDGKKRFRIGVPSERLVLSAIRAGIGVFSPHTSLDSAPGRMGDWLAAAIGSGATSVLEPHPTVASAGMGRRVAYARPRTLVDAIARIKKHLGVSRLRVAAPASKAFVVRSAAFCPGAGGALFDRVGDVDLLVTGEMRHHDVLAHVATGRAVVLAEHSNSERGYLPIYARAIRDVLPGVDVTIARADADPLRVR